VAEAFFVFIWLSARKVGLDVTPAVGTATATEFHAYTALYHSIPDLAQILRGEGDGIAFPHIVNLHVLTHLADFPDVGRTTNSLTFTNPTAVELPGLRTNLFTHWLTSQP
jgi:hypothetical protein